MKKNLSKSLLALVLLVVLPNLASAHILLGTTHGFRDGFLHPLTGWDHLLAMIAVGLWAAQHRGRALWLIPLSFVSVMVLGGILGVAGVRVPGVELAIAISVLTLGGLVATMTRFRPSLSMAVVGLFALFHGYAHGHEMPVAASALPFSVGFILATALLHGLGLAAGLWFQEQPRVLRWAGAAIAASSICFFVS
ncbi:MAG TPA: HupE/UreJ family protein [Verrucomicrobiae bacterium]|jgi:urease accessory protein|nr:HupE/UreJ family protein [Verrucomicrobiae bacterium]